MKPKKIFALLIFSLLLTTNIIGQTKINASDIINDIKNGKNIELKNVTITGVLDLTFMKEAIQNTPKKKWKWTNGGSNTIEKTIKIKISFDNCVFEDDVLAYIPDKESGYTFIANFKNIVYFTHCNFKENAMFKYSDFEKDSSFEGCKFNGDSTFKYAEFKNNTSFKNTYFKEDATFKYADFDENTSFENAKFKESASFKYTEFNNGVSFKETQFQEDLDIKYMVVKGDFIITGMQVGDAIDSKYTKINGKKFTYHK